MSKLTAGAGLFTGFKFGYRKIRLTDRATRYKSNGTETHLNIVNIMH